jgi:3-oxoacyl-[acyl-carrier protein] reductase
MRLAGKVALFAGAGGGMRSATALLFAKHGAKVVLAARRAEPLAELVDTIRDNSGQASYIAADLMTEEGMRSAVAHAESSFGRLDIAFNNLGDFVYPHLAVEQTSLEQWNYLTDINLKTAFLITRYAVPAMQRAGRGVLLHLAASADVRAMSHPGYAAAKMGLIGFTQRTALAYRSQNIRIICLCPSAMRNLFSGQQVALPDPALTRHGSSEDLAWAALFFASDEAAWLTGLTVPIDGGNSLATLPS